MERNDLNAFSSAATTPLGFGIHPGPRDTATPQKRKARILVVDDDPGLLRLLTIRLRAENYEVEAVESAGVRVIERVPCLAHVIDTREAYLRTKKEKMGHLLEGL